MRSGILPGHRDDAVRPQDDLFGHANGTLGPRHRDPRRPGSLRHLRHAPRAVRRAGPHHHRAGRGRHRRPRGLGDPQGRRPLPLVHGRGQGRGARPLAHRGRPGRGRRRSAASTSCPVALGRLQREGGARRCSTSGSAPDAKNPEEYVLYLGQGGLGLPDESYYREERHAEPSSRHTSPHVARMLASPASVDGATDDGSRRSAGGRPGDPAGRAHWDNVATRDAVEELQPLHRAALRGLAPAVRWDGSSTASARARRPSPRSSSASRPTSRACPRCWARTPPRRLQAWLAFHVVRVGGAAAVERAGRREVRLHGGHLSGSRRTASAGSAGVRSSRARSARPWASSMSPGTSRPRPSSGWLDLVANLVEAYRRSHSSGLDWMGPETREQALAKLGRVHPQGRLPGPVARLLRAGRSTDDLRRQRPPRPTSSSCDRQLDKLGGPIDRDEWLMTPQTVNAYYNPLMNEIVFPAGDPAAAVLRPRRRRRRELRRHRRGHRPRDRPRLRRPGLALRRRRRRCATGGPRRTGPGSTSAPRRWSPSTARSPRSRLPDEKVNGALTVGENIGDLGGLAIALRRLPRSPPRARRPPSSTATPARSGSSSAGRRSGPARPGPRRPSGCSRSTRTPRPRSGPTRCRNCDEFHEAFGGRRGRRHVARPGGARPHLLRSNRCSCSTPSSPPSRSSCSVAWPAPRAPSTATTTTPRPATTSGSACTRAASRRGSCGPTRTTRSSTTAWA